ncbi:MAG: hypothetical protein M0R76_14135 [Proteobacteria bacterium]|nr:hypothetical protein [Pseudomonadota bacterium]
MARLISDAEPEREAAFEALETRPPEEVLPVLCRTLLTDLSSEAMVTCMDLIEHLGGSVSLEDIRTDGWLERLGAQIASFDAVTGIIGRRYLAYAIILGVHIRTLTRDPSTPANTMVEFSTGDNLQQVLPIGEFRAQLVRAMLQIPEAVPTSLSLPLTHESAEALLGHISLLLAPLFDFSVRFVAVYPSEGTLDGVVGILTTTGFNHLPITAFREAVRIKLARDEAGTREDPFRLDLSAIDGARQARDDGQPARVISLLETWPGLLATLLKTPTARQLTEHQRHIIAEGLLMLGDAFHTLERDTWAEELYRLGLQYTRGIDASAPLFLHLGRLLLRQDRPGEAIAFFRRAIALNERPLEAKALLARCLLRRNKLVGAALLLRELRDQGYPQSDIGEDIRTAQRLLADAQLKWPAL